MRSTVAVVIPVRNDAEGLPHAVASVLAQSHPVDEVALAVGPSTDGTETVAAELAAQHEIVRVVENPRGEIASALNAGISATSADRIVRLDARCSLGADYVAHALETLHAHDAANVGAVQLAVGESATQRAIAAAMMSRAGSGGASYRQTDADADARPRRVDSAFLGVFRREALDAVGGYDERFLRNEDSELNIRLGRLTSWQGVWLDPRLGVEYRPRRTLRALARQYFDYGRWRFVTTRNHRTIRLRQLAAPVIVVTLGVAAVASIWQPVVGLVVIGGYVAVLVSAAATARNVTMPERPVVAVALGVMHLAWGLGFVSALVRNAHISSVGQGRR